MTLDLETHLAQLSFDDPQPFLVLADALQAEQNPWGELIALQCAGKTELANELIARHAFPAHCEWQFGFVKTATIVPDEPTLDSLLAAMTAFFALPVSRLCDGIVFAPKVATFTTTRGSGEWEVNLVSPYRNGESLFERVPQQVTRLSFGPWPAAPADGYVSMPGFREMSGWFQRITELSMTGTDSGVRDRFLLPNCKKLSLHCGSMGMEVIPSLRESELPVLETLVLSMGGYTDCILDDVYSPEDEVEEDESRYPATYSAGDLASLTTQYINKPRCGTLRELRRCNVPALRHLDLSDSMMDRYAVEQLVTTPQVAQLKTLDLARCMLDDNIEPLVNAAATLAHLERLDLRGNRINATFAAALRAAVPNVLLDDEREYPALFMRFVGTME